MRSSGRNANLKEKRIIAAAKLNPDNWWVIKNIGGRVQIRHKSTNSERELKCS